MKNGANSKDTVKKKPLTGQVSQPQHSPILKKSYSNCHPPTPLSMSAKTTPIKRRQIANKYSKIPKRIDDKVVITEKNKTAGQTPVTNIVPEIRKEVIGMNAMSGNAWFVKTSANNIPQKQQLKDHRVLTSVAEDAIVFSNNTESDTMSAFVEVNSGNHADEKRKSTSTIDPSLHVLKMGLSFQNSNSVDLTNGTINVAPEATAEIITEKTNSAKFFSGVATLTATDNFSPITTNTEWLTYFTEQKISLPTHQLLDEAQQDISSKEHRKDGNSVFVASTNKRDVLNLSVSTEMKNPEVATQAKSKVDTYNSPSFNEEGVDCNGTLRQSKSVQSIIKDYFPRLYCQDDQNLAYIQCACVDDCFRPDPKVLCPEVRTCFVLLPVLTRAGRAW